METEKKIEAPTEPVLVSVGTWNFQKPDSKKVTFRIPPPPKDLEARLTNSR